MKRQVNAIILAAGKGTRMKSSLIKVLHEVSGKAILQFVVDAIRKSGILSLYVVVGYQADKIKERFAGQALQYVEQKEQLGTGHAVQQVLPDLDASNPQSIILAGDCPLIQSSTIETLIDTHQKKGAGATLLTALMDDPTGYGRIVRSDSGDVLAIVEQKDCTSEQAAIKEVNSGVYVFDTSLLIKHLNELTTENEQKEYYLTDIIEILRQNGHRIAAVVSENADELIGVNTPEDLAAVQRVVQV